MHRKCFPGPDGDIARSHRDDFEKWEGNTNKSQGYPLVRLEEPRLPTRVIDVGTGDIKIEPRLLISGNRRAKYATLSHCWEEGRCQPLQTTSRNFKDHEKEIHFHSLPQTFQDAIIVARKLGFRYIWIDSLCIIQDSPKDWQMECTKMADIYRYSSVTIAGAGASDSHAGFLQQRFPFAKEALAHLWEYRNSKPESISRTLIRNEDRFIVSAEHHTTDYSPLEDRGWIL